MEVQSNRRGFKMTNEEIIEKVTKSIHKKYYDENEGYESGYVEDYIKEAIKKALSLKEQENKVPRIIYVDDDNIHNINELKKNFKEFSEKYPSPIILTNNKMYDVKELLSSLQEKIENTKEEILSQLKLELYDENKEEALDNIYDWADAEFGENNFVCPNDTEAELVRNFYYISLKGLINRKFEEILKLFKEMGQ